MFRRFRYDLGDGTAFLILRLLSNLGSYPPYTIRTPNHLFDASGEVVWSVTRQWVISEDDRPPEVAWLWPEEIRLYSALSLVEPEPELRGRYRILTWGYPLILRDLPSDVAFDDAFRTYAASLAQSLADEENNREFSLKNPNRDAVTKHISNPMEVLGITFSIDQDDDLLMRGLDKFLRATELQRFPQFTEEAGLAAFISREAGLEIIRQAIEQREGSASFDDAHDHIRSVFPTGDALASVFEIDHINRVMFVHPSSRYGEFWSPPVHREECMDAIHNLVHLYRYILLGEVWDPEDAPSLDA